MFRFNVGYRCLIAMQGDATAGRNGPIAMVRNTRCSQISRASRKPSNTAACVLRAATASPMRNS